MYFFVIWVVRPIRQNIMLYGGENNTYTEKVFLTVKDLTKGLTESLKIVAKLTIS